MVNQVGEVIAVPVAIPDRLFERVEGEVGAQRS